MSESFQKKMFEPFEQEAELRRDHINGQGLGLYIVKTLVDAMGGKIKWQSMPNQGTTFVVTMDYEICYPETLKVQVKKNIFDKLNGRRILICEDQRINAEIVQNMLEHMNVSADIAKNGRDGVAKFAQSEEGYYDAVLMDLRMPVMDGRIEMLRAGGNEFVYKPVDMQELYEKLCRYILQEQ